MIGGEMAIAPDWLQARATADDRPVPSTGRAALHLILRQLLVERPGAPVFLPEYLCESMVHAAKAASTNVHYYTITDDLRMGDPTGLPLDAVVVLVRYFGLVDVGADALRLLDGSSNRRIVCDAVHAPWSAHEKTASYTFTSLRKAYAIPDGAPVTPELSWNDGAVATAFATRRLAAALAKNVAEAAASGDEVDHQLHLGLYRAAEKGLDAPESFVARSPDFSVRLAAALDVETVMSRRRTNFRHLERRLAEEGVRPLRALASDATPFCLPVHVADRDAVRARLAEQKIFCPVHWPRPADVPWPSDAARALYDHELSLVVDQRYGPSEMNRLADAFLEAVADSGCSSASPRLRTKP